METIQFKTNIKCAGCIANVTPYLNEVVGENNWNVDINNPSKILTVPESIGEDKVKEALQKAGYTAERTNQ